MAGRELLQVLLPGNAAILSASIPSSASTSIQDLIIALLTDATNAKHLTVAFGSHFQPWTSATSNDFESSESGSSIIRVSCGEFRPFKSQSPTTNGTKRSSKLLEMASSHCRPASLAFCAAWQMAPSEQSKTTRHQHWPT